MSSRTPNRESQLHRWLDDTLGPQWVAAALAGDASFRRYLRVTDRDGRRWVVMDAPPDKEDVGPFIRIASLLTQAGLIVPRVEASERERGFLLLSDLGDELYLGLLQSAPPSRVDELYDRALAALVQMQLRADGSGLASYDRDRLRTELALFHDWFLGAHLGVELRRAEQRELWSVFASLESAALAQPQAFVHRDYHSRNLLEIGEDIGILDFQDAVRGPVTYDLVSLLRDVYIEWPSAQVYRWVEDFRRRAVAAGLVPEVDGAEFRRWFDLMGVQRHLKVAGIFARLHHRDHKSGYLSSLPLTLDYLVQVVSSYPELSFLDQLLRALVERFDRAVLVAGR